MAGKKPDEYKGVAKFLTFLSQPEIQAQWHQETGYLPITMAAYEHHEEVRLLRQEPGHRRLRRADDRQDDQATRAACALGNFVQIRDVIEEELEAVLGRQEDREGGGWTTAAKRGNEIIDRFAKANKG